MNVKSKLVFFGSLILLGLLVGSLLAQIKSDAGNSLTVDIKEFKPKYVLGELVSFNIEIKNQSSSAIYLPGEDVESGYLSILISQDGNTYKKYSNGSWGNKKSKGKVIKPSELIRSRVTVLSNVVPDTRNLSDIAVRQFKDKQLMTVYAFPKTGDYYIKAVLLIPDKQGNKEIESEPIRISIGEPQGEDLEVWNKIKDRADFAYFIQNGEFPDFKKVEEQTEFQQEIEKIITQHPNSFYAESLQQSFTKFRADEAKRQEAMEKLKQKQSQ